jgi:hypothetical protein
VGMAYFKVLSWHLHAGTEENYDNEHSNSQCTSQAKTGHLSFELTCLINQHCGALCGTQAHFTSLGRRKLLLFKQRSLIYSINCYICDTWQIAHHSQQQNHIWKFVTDNCYKYKVLVIKHSIPFQLIFTHRTKIVVTLFYQKMSAK